MSLHVIRSTRVLANGTVGPASIHLRDGKIVAVENHNALPPEATLDDFGALLVTPGIVDSHVHINEPGRTEWEGFRTATQAAAAGGITTVVDMPLNCIPATTSAKAAELKREQLKNQLYVNVVFWGGVIPGNTHELNGLQQFGVPGCKCFLCPSGVDEFPNVTRADLEQAMPVMRDLGRTLLVHAELPAPLEVAEREVQALKLPPTAYSTYLRSRPNAAEDEAIAMMIELAERHRCPVHVVHLASGSAVPLLAAAQKRGTPISAETCLHYLSFTAEEIADGATQYKCAPPIRNRANQEQLWRGLQEGVISMVVSDHSPCTPQLKKLETGDFMSAWGGIAGLQLGLSVLWTRAKAHGVSVEHMFRWNSEAPAKLAGLAHRKGKIAAGFDADFVVWDDEATFEVEPARLHHKHAVTPYAGQRLFGRVERTFVGGSCVYDRTSGLSSRPVGAWLAG